MCEKKDLPVMQRNGIRAMREHLSFSRGDYLPKQTLNKAKKLFSGDSMRKTITSPMSATIGLGAELLSRSADKVDEAAVYW